MVTDIDKVDVDVEMESPSSQIKGILKQPDLAAQAEFASAVAAVGAMNKENVGRNFTVFEDHDHRKKNMISFLNKVGSIQKLHTES